MNYKLSKYTVFTDVLDETDSEQKRILFASRTGISFLINSDLFKKLQEAEFGKIKADKLTRLIDHEVIILKEEDEFKEIMTLNRCGSKDSKTLSTTIQPSANCQLGCPYCGQVHTKYTMTDKIKNKVVERIKSKLDDGHYNSIEVTWYGGEPLLGYSSILEISSQLKEIAQNKNLQYGGYLITNGLNLKPDIFKELYLNHSVNQFQITIDTTKEHHDNRRMMKEGNATFDIIMNNIKKIVNLPYYKDKTGKAVSIRMNIDKTNFESVTTFIDYLADNELQDKVNIYFSPIINWGQENAEDMFGLTKEQFAEYEIEWYLYAMNKGFTFDYFLPARDYVACMVDMKDAEVYDAFGNILPCYEFSYTPFYDSPEYKIGNLFDDKNSCKYAVREKWFDMLAEKNQPCRSCNLFPVCNGACPKKWIRGEIGCPPFKLNIEDRLVLQYLMNKTNIKELI